MVFLGDIVGVILFCDPQQGEYVAPALYEKSFRLWELLGSPRVWMCVFVR